MTNHAKRIKELRVELHAAQQRIYAEIGERFLKHRNKKGWTQAEVAEMLGCNRSSIAKIEAGTQRLMLHTVYEFAAELGIKPKDLLPDI